MKRNQYISNAVIRRMPRYYRYLGELKEKGVQRISSGELSESMGLTASQVRQDLNHFGDFGQQGFGYNVDQLRTEIAKILGLENRHNVIIIGAGHMGQALANYANFEKRGFCVTALFDIDEALIGGETGGHPVYSLEELPEYIAAHQVDIAALTLPKTEARKMAAMLAENGVKAFLNFASVDLKFDDPEIMVENVHVSDSLMILSYRLHSED